MVFEGPKSGSGALSLEETNHSAFSCWISEHRVKGIDFCSTYWA